MNPWSVLIAVWCGVVGFGYFVYGMKQQEPVPLFCGTGLCLVPFFIGNPLAAGALGLVLTLIPVCRWVAERWPGD